MKNLFNLIIVTPKKNVFSGSVQRVDVPGVAGEFCILPEHAPLITIMNPGIIQIFFNQTKKTIYISGGILEVQFNTVNILVDNLINSEDLDEKKKLKAKKKLKKYRFKK